MPGFSFTRRAMRSTFVISTPTRMHSLAGTGTLGDHILQVLDGKQAHDLLRLQLAGQRVRVNLRHDLLELGQTRRSDRAILIAELVVRNPPLDVSAEVGSLDLYSQLPLEAEQNIQQIDRLSAQITEQRRSRG